MRYFAYGSNMATSRLRAPNRAPSARSLGVEVLRQHSLRFHKKSQDVSGKCDAYSTGRTADVVVGVVFEVDPRDKAALDGAEGLGRGYEEREVPVEMDGETVRAFCYLAEPEWMQVNLAPYDWYKDWILLGAREHGLPEHYIRSIEMVEAHSDPDDARARREREAQRKSRPD